MTRRARLAVFAVFGAGLAAFFVAASLRLHPFGTTYHPYRDLAIPAAVHHVTANAVASVTFDQRGLDTLIEETIMLASVLGAVALLRPAENEQYRREKQGGTIQPSTRLVGYLLLPLTLLVGADLAVHGNVTPGGGFQGGVVLATAAHFLYVAGSFPAVRRIRPAGLHELLEGLFAAAFATLGLSVLAATGAFLANPLPKGTFGQLLSGGTVPVLNGIVAVEIAASTIVLIGTFLDQEILVRKESGGHE